MRTSYAPVRNTISVELSGELGTFLSLSFIGLDDAAPTIQIIGPPDGSLTNVNPYNISLSYSNDISGLDSTSLEVFVNGSDETTSLNGNFDYCLKTALKPYCD